MNAVNLIDMPACPLRMNKWDSIDWSKIYKYVRKLRQRIFRAEQLGQKRKVRKLQRLMVISKANLLLSIKKVTQINKGKRTAGIDNIKAVTSNERLTLFNMLKDYSIKHIKPLPAKRLYIPKKDGKKLRPLGIPIIKDRIYQNIVKNALEPQWEAKFESTSYGFRPKRSTHDAIENLYKKLCKKSNGKYWIFEGDFKGCFDNLGHEHIMDCIQNFPYKNIIFKWLKAGYVDNNVFHRTEAGTPQGSVISPLLANIALHGMEQELGVQYRYVNGAGYRLKSDSVAVVRFADDFIILSKSRDKAESMYSKLQPYLKKRGIKLAEDKTKITHVNDGFDFLGVNIRRYETKHGPKLLVKPSKGSIKKAKQSIKELFIQFRGRPMGELIFKLNPVIRGIGNYWSSVVASKTFSAIDYYIWIKVYKYMKRLHPNKSKKWLYEKYMKPEYTGVIKSRIPTDPKNEQNQLIRMSWIPIIRHTLVKYTNSPDNPSLTKYFEKRDEKEFSRFHTLSKQKIAKRSNFICRVCKQSFVGNENLQVNYIIPKMLGGEDKYENLELLHDSCFKQHKLLLLNYGGKDLTRVHKYFRDKNITPSTSEGIKIMKQQFKLFKYQ